MTDKDKKIIEDAERAGTPIFVFTAKDELALQQLLNYSEDCIHFGLDKHGESVKKRANEFYKWRRANPDKMKMPD